jgi:NDP-sugar pyrophosphorylase family protein
MKMARGIKEPGIRTAVVLAAGFGTRLRPLTDDIPKPAIQFLNRPVIHYIFDQLLDYGVERIFVNLSHLPERMRQVLAPYHGSVEIIYSEEKDILGTAGVFSNFKNDLPSHFFVVNGDIFSSIPFAGLESLILEGKAEAVLLLKKKAACCLYTSLTLEDNGVISSIGGGSHFFCGAYAASKSFLSPINNIENRELVPDLLAPKMDRRLIKGIELNGVWHDLGSPKTFLEASESLLQQIEAGQAPMPPGNHLIKQNGFLALAHDSSEIAADADLKGFVVLGAGCRVGTMSKLEDTVVLPDTMIPPRAAFRNVIISKDKVVKA